MKPVRTATTRTPSEATASATTGDEVRRRAFEIYEERGREDGHELDDWLEAEKEVLESLAA